MATYSKSELVKAIRQQCNECNDVHGAWHAGNDCTGKSCKLYPYRPGDGPGHAVPMKTHQRPNPAGIAAIRASAVNKALKRSKE